MAALSDVIEDSLGKEVDQNGDNLNVISSILLSVAEIVSELDMNINKSVSFIVFQHL